MAVKLFFNSEYVPIVKYYTCFKNTIVNERSPLWSSGYSSWLQIQEVPGSTPGATRFSEGWCI
jgi:hypothetical protein